MNKPIGKVFMLNKRLFFARPLAYIGYALLLSIYSATPFLLTGVQKLLFDALDATARTSFYSYAILAFGLGVASVYTITAAGKVDIALTFSVGKRLRSNLLKALIDMQMGEVPKGGEIVDILHYDIEALEYMLLTQIELLCQLIVLLVSLIIIATMSLGITVFVMIPVIAVAFILWFYSDRYKNKYAMTRSKSIDYSQFLSECINNREALQFFCEPESLRKRFLRICTDRGKSELGKSIFAEIFNAGTEFLYHFGITVLLFIYALRVRDGMASISELALYLSFVGCCLSFLNLLTAAAYGIRSGEDSLERIAGCIAETATDTIQIITNEVKPASLQTTASSTLQAVHFSDFRLINHDTNHSFSFYRGDVVAITGPIGSGKSYFVNALLGYMPYEGSIAFYEDIDHRIGYVNQRINLFDASIDENILLFTNEKKKSWVDSIAQIDASQFGERERIGAGGKELSEGQRQRVSIARALQNCDGIIILDDAFSYLDKSNRKLVFDKVAALGLIVLVITNDSNIISRANKEICLSNLKIHYKEIANENQDCK